MFKEFARRIFLKYYKLDYCRVHIENPYNEYGMVKPQKRIVKYYATPVLASNKCIKNSMRKYGITPEDSGEEALRKAFVYHNLIETCDSCNSITDSQEECEADLITKIIEELSVLE